MIVHAPDFADTFVKKNNTKDSTVNRSFTIIIDPKVTTYTVFLLHLPAFSVELNEIWYGDSSRLWNYVTVFSLETCVNPMR